MFMEKIFIALLLSMLMTAICLGKSTNATDSIRRDWGTSVSGVRLSANLTNTNIAVGSSFSLFVEMENTSTNLVYVGESSPEQEFSVFLINDTGRAYRLTRTPLARTRSMLMKIEPGKKANWTIAVSCGHYFEPPGFIPTNEDVPAGDYYLKVARKFSIENKPKGIESNLIRVEIK
jgi:hypothetical protein